MMGWCGCAVPREGDRVALAWVLRRQEVSSAIIGATRPEQVAEKAAAAEYQIAPELFARAEDILASLRQGPLAWERDVVTHQCDRRARWSGR